MNPLSLFRLGALFGHATPHGDATPDRVSVKRAYRDRLVEEPASFAPGASRPALNLGGYTMDRPLDPDLTGCDVAHIRAHLPNTPRAPEAPLRAALVARAYRHALRAGRRLSDEEGNALANAIDELSAYALGKGRV